MTIQDVTDYTYNDGYDEWKHLHPTVEAMPELTPAQALVVYSTMNAYSYYKYGPINWGRIVQWLNSMDGYTFKRIEWILRSKHMRWCGDASNNRVVTLEDFQSYFERNKDDLHPKRLRGY